MTRPFKVKMTDAEVEALGALLSHDPDLIIENDWEGVGLISAEDRDHLLALYNRAQAMAHRTKEARSQ
jgi:hypothetical protein